jgi:hypothetical protein
MMKVLGTKTFISTKLFTSAEVERIVGEVGIKYAPDRARLENDLKGFVADYLTFLANTKTQQKKRVRIARKIQRCASELFDAIEKPVDIELAGDIWKGLSISTGELQQALQELYKAVEVELKRPHTRRVSWCVQRLAVIYECHFKRRAGVSRPHSGGEIGGPFVRFVLAVTQPLGIAVSPDSIVKALAARHMGKI